MRDCGRVSKRSAFRVWRMVALVLGLLAVTSYLYSPNWMLSWLYASSERRLVYDPQKESCHNYSPAFPSAGGPGCKPKCEPKDGEETSSYGAIFLNKTHNWPRDLLENMHFAGSILKKYGTPRSLDTERSVYLHVTFDYYCCYTKSEAIKIGEFLNSYSWTTQAVSFDRMACAIHSHGDLVSLVLMADQDSQKKLLKLALESEQELEKKTGIPKHIPHTHLQGFHMTLATVNQREFPVRSALEEINRVIPPGKWHRTPVVFHRPICRRCDKLIYAVKI